MNIQKNGVNLLLVAEVLLLIVVLVLGIMSGVAGKIRDITGDSENGSVVKGTEDTSNDWFSSESGTDSENESTTDTEDDSQLVDNRWSIPEDYAESRVTFSDSVEALLSSMTTEQKVAQLFLVSPEALTGYNRVTVFGNASKQAMDKYPVGGLVYSEINYQGEEQFASLLKGAKDYSQETFGYTIFTIAADDATEAITTGLATIETTGIDNAIKYFPDKANAVDGGSGILSDSRTFEELSNGSLESYQTSIDAGAKYIVVGNVIVESITDDENVPCTLSSRTVGLLRESMGYNGVLITEDFSNAGFVSVYGNGNACVEAIKAGMDMIYMPYDFETAYTSVLDAVKSGNISEDRINNAVGRILTAKGV